MSVRAAAQKYEASRQIGHTTRNSAQKRNNVKTTVFTVLGLLVITAPANAHGTDGGFGLFGGFGGLGPGGLGLGGWGWSDHHGNFDGLGLGLGLGFGFGFFDADRAQMRFEDKFNTLQTQYNDGVATGTDFFSSTEYDTIVDKTQTLNDRYDFFLTGVEHSIDRLGDVITFVQDDVTFFNDLLTKFQANDHLPPERLDRIEMWINRVTDRLNTKIDTLTEKQTTLQTNLPTYQAFQSDISTFLSDIVAAGGGTTGATSASLTSLATLAVTQRAGAVASFSAEGAATSLSPTAVPEPAAAGLVLLASGAMLTVRRRQSAARKPYSRVARPESSKGVAVMIVSG
jgi:hypothetical protein